MSNSDMRPEIGVTFIYIMRSQSCMVCNIWNISSFHDQKKTSSPILSPNLSHKSYFRNLNQRGHNIIPQKLWSDLEYNILVPFWSQFCHSTNLCLLKNKPFPDFNHKSYGSALFPILIWEHDCVQILFFGIMLLLLLFFYRHLSYCSLSHPYHYIVMRNQNISCCLDYQSETPLPP